MKILPCAKKYSYSESPQSNPLRWQILHRIDADTFEAKTAVFRCKDYFNECVALYHGHVLPMVYGFEAKDLKLNDEGVYVQLSGIDEMECWVENLGSINKYAAQFGMPPVEILEKQTNKALVLIPRKFFDSTWKISLLTYLIRVANVGEVVADPEWKVHPTLNIDCPFRPVFAKVMAQGFKTPCDIATYYYAGKSAEYKGVPSYSAAVHNNGVYNWVSLLQAEGKM